MFLKHEGTLTENKQILHMQEDFFLHIKILGETYYWGKLNIIS